MKKERQEAILRIVRERTIDTQEGLRRALEEAGFSATQATVSRDIRELRLIKMLGSDGRYGYRVPDRPSAVPLSSLFRDAVVRVESAGNIVVVQCLSGSAGAVCASTDALALPEVVGTLAGDDTFFCVVRTEADAMRTAEIFRSMAAK